MLGGTKFGKGSGSRGFEHLNSVSVNDFEAFCDVFKCIKHASSMHRSMISASQTRINVILESYNYYGLRCDEWKAALVMNGKPLSSLWNVCFLQVRRRD